MQRNIGFKKILCFLDLPNAETGIIVDLLLKKNWHSQDLRFKIADFRFIIAKNFDPLYSSVKIRTLKSATQEKLNSSN